MVEHTLARAHVKMDGFATLGTLLAHVVDVLVIPDDLAGDDFLCDVFVTSFVSAREKHPYLQTSL